MSYHPHLLLPAMRVGLFGGSFNPAHDGHLHVSRTARRRLGLHAVWWLVSPGNPLKETHNLARFDDRLARARVLADEPGIYVSDFEARAGTRYTVDTVAALKEQFPGVNFVWIMGADNLENFTLWKGWTEIAEEVGIAVVDRPGYALAPTRAAFAARYAGHRLPESWARMLPEYQPPVWVVLHGQRHALSSTLIRSTGHWQPKSEGKTP